MTTQIRWLIWLAIAAVFMLFIFAVKAILLPFIVGMLVAYFLDPAADKLESWRCSRLWATSIITLTFFTATLLVFTIIMPLMVDQLMRLIVVAPSYVLSLQEEFRPQLELWLSHLNMQNDVSSGSAITGFSKEIITVGTSVIKGVLSSGAALVNMVSLVFITPVVAFYLLKDWDRITAIIDDLLPRKHRDVIRAEIACIDDTLSGFVRGQINVIVIMMTYNVIGLSIVGLNFAVIIGVISGLLVIIPYAGTLLSALLAVGMAYVQFDDIGYVIAVAAVFAGGQILEGNFLTPRLVGEKVGLHPVWVIFGMLVGAALFGFVGVFLAIPVTAIAGVLVRFAVRQYRASSLYSAESGANHKEKAAQ